MGPLLGAALFLGGRYGDNLKPDHNIGKCPAFTTIWGLHPTDAGQSMGRPAPMTAQFNKTEQEYEVQVRNLVRLVSACTLGLW